MEEVPDYLKSKLPQLGAEMGMPSMGMPPMGEMPMGQPMMPPMGMQPMGEMPQMPPMSNPMSDMPPMGMPPMGNPMSDIPQMPNFNPQMNVPMMPSQMGMPPMMGGGKSSKYEFVQDSERSHKSQKNKSDFFF
jgi:hypothetical protein